jgi:hypothetical protein
VQRAGLDPRPVTYLRVSAPGTTSSEAGAVPLQQLVDRAVRQGEALAELSSGRAGLVGGEDYGDRLVGQALAELVGLVAGTGQPGDLVSALLLQMPGQPLEALQGIEIFGGASKYLHQGVPTTAYSNFTQNTPTGAAALGRKVPMTTASSFSVTHRLGRRGLVHRLGSGWRHGVTVVARLWRLWHVRILAPVVPLPNECQAGLSDQCGE